MYSSIGVRDQFRFIGGAEVKLPEYFLHCLPENQVVLPKYYLIFFARIWLFEKFQGGGGGAAAAMKWAMKFLLQVAI